MRPVFLFLCLAAAFSAGAQRSSYTSLKELRWLTGSWAGMANGKPFYEAWRMVNDSLLINFAIEVKGSDTLVTESASIRLSGGQIRMYGDKGASWNGLRLTGNKIVLANDTLRYANRIEWSHSKSDHWMTLIQNPGGQLTYDMVRAPAFDAAVNRYATAAESQGR